MDAEEYTPLGTARAMFFTFRGGVKRRIDAVEPPDVPDGEQLEQIVEQADELSRAAGHLRHLLPERADEKLEQSIQAVQREGARYMIVWPDGELCGGWQAFYVQRPAMLRRWQQVTRTNQTLRVYDIKLGKFILVED